MDKEIIEYCIPIQDKDTVSKDNRLYVELFGEDVFTSPYCRPYKTTDEHIDILINRLYDAIQRVGDDGGWYIGDGINVKIEVEYEPESK